MAPVKPTDLMKAFKPVLTSRGGIKSLSDVPRLTMLMKKYSKKMVSKCVYCSILKATTPDVLNSFLQTDGWGLINNWLKESTSGDNRNLLLELLEVLVRCPMNIDRLKLNDTPKLVKSISKSSDKETSAKAKLVVNKWTELIKPNENVNNGNLVRKKRKKEKSGDDDDADSGKVAKLKTNGSSVLQPQTSNNDTVASSDDVIPTIKPTPDPKPAEEVVTGGGDTSSNRSRTTAKVKYGKSRSLGILEELNAKSKGPKKGENKGDKSGDKSGSSNKLTSNPTAPVSSSSSGQPTQAKTVASSKTKPVLKEAVGFIEDIVSLSSQTRKKRKTESKSKSPSGNTVKETGPDSSTQGDEATVEPMDVADEASDDAEEERVTSASGDGESNSNTTNVEMTTTTDPVTEINEEASLLPVPDVPELDNIVVPESEPIKLPNTFKSILMVGKSSKTKKSVRWRAEDKLKEVKLFELDETERTNVSKSNFGDFRANDIKNERQMLAQLRSNRGIPGAPSALVPTPVEKCITYLPWKLILIDLPEGLPLIEAGCQSEEKRLFAAAAISQQNADFFPIKEGSTEYYPKEPDSMDVASETNSGPTVIPLEDENFTVTDYSALPYPPPRTGELYPSGGPPPGLPGNFPRPGMGPRVPGYIMPRTPYPQGFVPPPAGYQPFAGPERPNSQFPPTPAPAPGPTPRMPTHGRPMGPVGPLGPVNMGSAAGWNRPRPPPVCRYFLKSGSCRFMARCNYLHQYPNTNPPQGPGQSGNPE